MLMRNPGYEGAHRSWKCDVQFNEYDFGPNLVYSSFVFTPAKKRLQQLKIAGLPGVYDYSNAPGGYPVPEQITGTLKMFVKDAQEWGLPQWDMELLTMISPEARFLSMINSGKVRLEFINSNLFWLNADIEITEYTRFNLGFNITMKVTADPYWWEVGLASVEWSFHANAINQFDPEAITIDPTLRATCTYEEAPLMPGRYFFKLMAPPGWYADILIPDLDPEKTYDFGIQNIYNHGVYELYDQDNRRVWPGFTGVEDLTLRLISKSAENLIVGFADCAIYDVTGAGVQSGEIRTLDNPIQTLQATTNMPCQVYINGEKYTLEAGENKTIYGLNIPPRTVVPVTITGEDGCRGHLTYQRGAVSCTL